MSEEVNEEGAISSKGPAAGVDLCEEPGLVAEGDRGLMLIWATPREAYLPQGLAALSPSTRVTPSYMTNYYIQAAVASHGVA